MKNELQGNPSLPPGVLFSDIDFDDFECDEDRFEQRFEKLERCAEANRDD